MTQQGDSKDRMTGTPLLRPTGQLLREEQVAQIAVPPTPDDPDQRIHIEYVAADLGREFLDALRLARRSPGEVVELHIVVPPSAGHMEGRYTWRCCDCGHKQRFAAWEFNRRTGRPRCSNCGGTFFEPASRQANDAFALAGSIRKAARGGR